MNTLFARTLLWFIATVLLTFVAMVIATAIDFDGSDQQRAPLGTIFSLQLAEARNAYETGGPDALRKTLERFRRLTDSEGVLTDAEGRDLVSGQIRTDLRDAARRRRRGTFAGKRGGTVIGRPSRDGQYFYFLTLQGRGVVRWFLQPEVHLAVLLVLTVLSYAFARYLTSPVRKLQIAVECFGRGDFGSRVRSTRKDELGQLARTFDQMADRIETLLDAERRLLLDISHELRSPLARLGVAVELARSGEDVTRHLDRIEREAGRLNGLVGELLQVTRAEGDSSLMKREMVRLSELVASVAEDARVEAAQREVVVTVEQPEALAVQGDSELLRRALENVVRNAIRYTDPKTVVLISATLLPNSSVVIAVKDQGPGVPEESLPRLFDPFYRVDPDRNRVSGGTGLGLAIARRAVELHRGRIEAENGHPGLVVRITLPQHSGTLAA